MREMQSLIQVRDGFLSARVLDPKNKAEIDAALAFRHTVFLEELGWSVLDHKGQESDQYDQNSVHFGAFSESGEITGYCRLILPKSGFMIEKEFADLIDPGYCIRKENDTVEASRFAVARNLRGKGEGFRVIALLVRSLYQWAKLNKVRYIYAVSVSDYLGFLCGYFTCIKPIGPNHEYQAGISSSAVILDLEQLDLEKVKEFWAMLTNKPK